MDYGIFPRSIIAPEDLQGLDIFLSAYNRSERVLSTYDAVRADEKSWMVHSEYGFSEEELPKGCLSTRVVREAEFIREALTEADWTPQRALCVDITGMMRPQLLFLLAFLLHEQAQKVDLLYSEPQRYSRNERTDFSKGSITEVRQVDGYEGTHLPDIRSDLLVVGSGYDHELIAKVAEAKENAKKIQIFGLPALRPHMYQENVLRAARAAESVGGSEDANHPRSFAPAYDPFATAEVLSEEVHARAPQPQIGNLYLSPLGTKAQTVGFGLFYLCERIGTPTSVIFPFRERYSQETGKGVSRVWRYRVEFDIVRNFQEARESQSAA